MSIRAEYKDGVFVPLQEVERATPGEVYQVFSESELRLRAAEASWLKGVERSFEFWENEEDAVYDGPIGRATSCGSAAAPAPQRRARGEKHRL